MRPGASIGGAGQWCCEDGLQKVVDLVVGGLPVTGKKDNVTPGFKEEDVGKLQAGWPNLDLQEYCGVGPLTAMSWFLQGKKVTGNIQDR